MRPEPACTCGTCVACLYRASKRASQARRRRAGTTTVETRKRRAHQLVYRARARGELTPTPCACGCKTPLDQLEAHHDDYDRPLDVEWVCVPEHRRRHARERVAC